jgi:deoxyinosine 3'endonuclease (endonuclease V)
VLLVDGHGRLHPARCGVACFVGVNLGVPTIGVAKNPLSGTMSRRPNRGESVPVRIGRETLGYAVRRSAIASRCGPPCGSCALCALRGVRNRCGLRTTLRRNGK